MLWKKVLNSVHIQPVAAPSQKVMNSAVSTAKMRDGMKSRFPATAATKAARLPRTPQRLRQGTLPGHRLSIGRRTMLAGNRLFGDSLPVTGMENRCAGCACFSRGAGLSKFHANKVSRKVRQEFLCDPLRLGVFA